jgi:hypothetical protein
MQRVAVVLLLGGVLLVASWVVAGDPPQRQTAPAEEPLPVDQVSQILSDVNTQVELLRERLAMERRFAPPSRDPFRFSAPVEPPPVDMPPIESLPIAPEPPPLPQLVAILTDKTEAGVTRRAVFAVNGVVQIVKIGDRVDRFDVSRIDADGVDLKARDTSDVTRVSIK